MNPPSEAAAAWIYRGIWAGVVRWLRVPEHAPTLPAGSPDAVRSFRPAPGFLRYLKFRFWIGLVAIDLAIMGAWLVIAIIAPIAGAILLLPALAIAILPDIVAYIAIHLRYDTTWYVLTDRSLRIRRGIWIIHETTITFENIQNVSTRQGPLQRHFGIADVTVQTAGGGGAHGGHGQQGGHHIGILEGVADAAAIRDLIMDRVRHATGAGLGDEAADHHAHGHALRADTTRPTPSAPTWTDAHVELLREIRDAARRATARF